MRTINYHKWRGRTRGFGEEEEKGRGRKGENRAILSQNTNIETYKIKTSKV